MRTPGRASASASAMLLLAPFSAGGQAGSAGACNRGCLTGLMDDYLAALVDGDPSAEPALVAIRLKLEGGEISEAEHIMPAAHVFKIGADGLVHEIEAVGFTAPYNSPTGWE